MEWRATTSQAAQQDLDRLFADSIRVAAESLSEGGLTPFMLVIDETGGRALRALGAAVSGGEAGVVAALQQDGDDSALRARATVLDVTVRTPFTGDAIEVKLEHREGVAIDMLVPYRTTDDGISIEIDDASGAAGTPFLWPRT